MPKVPPPRLFPPAVALRMPLSLTLKGVSEFSDSTFSLPSAKGIPCADTTDGNAIVIHNTKTYQRDQREDICFPPHALFLRLVSSSSKAAAVKVHIFASRPDCRVSTVITCSTGPATAIQA